MRTTMQITRSRQAGMSLIEVIAGFAIISVMVLGTVTVMSNAHNLTRLTSSKQFATEKAISMIEELKSLVQTSAGSNIVTLDDYDDGVKNNMVLTTIGEKNKDPLLSPPPLPDDVMSGNVLTVAPDTWQYERLITVRKIKGQGNDVRLVNVKVFENLPRGGQILLAEVSSVIRTLAGDMPPTQVYDVYCLAIENVPGWWVYMSNVVPFVKSAISDLQSRNPGLTFRTHWITSLAYGRDLLYKPFINDAVDSNADINSVYFYPGKMPAACINASPSLCGDDYYYPSFFFRGHVSVDGNDTNGYAVNDNPQPYAIADQYNNAMRYYDEKALYDARKAAAANQTPPVTEEMTWRLLMDDMYMNPQNYTNALIINLHGELMPFPPVRNYSDAAKSPATAGLQNVRAVTHPEQLVYAAGSAVRLRVYTYTDPVSATPIMPVPLTVRIHGLSSWIPTNANILAIHGGVDNDGTGGVDAYDAAPIPAVAFPVPGQPNQMSWTYNIDGATGDTILKLYGSPLRTPIESSGRGLAAEDQLYGLDYIPSPVEDLTTGAVQFSTDLTSTSVRPKNTARWIISIPGAPSTVIPAAGAMLTVDTRIGDQETSGVLYPAAVDPENKSRTYVWCGPNAYVYGTANTPPMLPLTERFQILGDPRHCPYADLKRPNVFNPPQFPAAAIVGPPSVAAGAYQSTLGMGYNRYFDDMEDSDPARPVSPGRNRGGSAEITSANVEPFRIVASGAGRNNNFQVRINGVASAISTTLSASTVDMTAAQIVAKLIANPLFSAVATADAVSGRVRIASKARAGSSVQFDTAASNNCAAVVGFNNTIGRTAGWPGWVYSVGGRQYGINNNGNLTDAGWDTGAGSLEIDVHRLFQMLRSTLTRSNAIWTTMTGFSYYYIGIGNEIGYDSANGFPNSVPVSTKPFTGSGGSRYENSITGTVKYIRDNATPPVWWAKPWMGELYPDTAYATWLATGNIPTGTGANSFVRDDRAKFPPFNSTNLTDSVRRTKEMGSTTFFWSGTAALTFHHAYHNGSGGDQGTIAPAGKDIANNYSLPVPDTIDNARPFDVSVNVPADNPEDFLEPASYPNAYVARVLNTYYNHPDAPVQGSALVTLADPVTNAPAFIAVNGLSPTGVAGTTFIAKWSFLTLIQSYLNGGLYTDASASPTANHIRQLPRVVITDPNENTDLKNKSSITVGWNTTWKRWDGATYTTDPKYANWIETLNMKYAVLYSPSNGIPDKDPARGNPTGWKYIQDNSVAYTGVKPDPAHEISVAVSAATTSSSTTFNTPAGTFPQGNYLIRVEGYRQGYPLHYSFHQYRAFFQRSP